MSKIEIYDLSDAALAALTPTPPSPGTIRMSVNPVTPNKHVLCDGSVYPKATYPALAAAMGDVPDFNLNPTALFNSTATYSTMISTGATANDKIIAAGSNGAYVRSLDGGQTWTAGTPFVSSNLTGLAYSPSLGLFVACGANSVIYTSPDLITWTQRTCPVASQTLNFVVWTGSAFYISNGTSSSTANLFKSTDGITWTSVSLGGGALAVNRLLTANGILMISVNTYVTYYTSDGVNFTTIPAATWAAIPGSYGFFTPTGFIYLNNKYYISTQVGIYTTTDFSSFKLVFNPLSSVNIYNLMTDGTSIYAVSANGIIYSPDGVVWSASHANWAVQISSNYPNFCFSYGGFCWADTYGSSLPNSGATGYGSIYKVTKFSFDPTSQFRVPLLPQGLATLGSASFVASASALYYYVYTG